MAGADFLDFTSSNVSRKPNSHIYIGVRVLKQQLV